MIYRYPDLPEDLIRALPIEKKPKGNPGKKKRPTYAGVVCAFDIETSNIKKTRQAIMYIWQFQIGFEITIIGRRWPEFLELLQRLSGILGETKLVTYVHNLSFEFQFLSGIWHFAPEDVFCTEPRHILRADMGPLELRCSYRLSNMSLLQFTTQMKATHRKLSGDKFDYTKIRYPWTRLTDYETAYAVNDVIGLVEAVTQQMTNDGDSLYTIPMTSTGYVRRDIKRGMKTFNWNTMQRLIPPYTVHRKLKEAFRGGNTHANRHYVGQTIHGVHSVDMTSAYPAAQICKEFPMGRWYEIDPEKVTMDYIKDLTGRRHKALLLSVAFLGIRLQDPRWPVPYLPYDKCRHVIPIRDPEDKDKRNPRGKQVSYDNGRIMAAEYLETTITDIDLRIITEEYTWDEMKILYFAFSTYGPLPAQYREVVIDYYHKKTTLKNVPGSEWLYDKSKNKLNAVYGCSVQDPLQISYIYDESGEVPYKVKEENLEEIYNRYTRYACMSYAWGVWTTCYCRLRLEEGMRLIYQTGEEQKKETGRIKTHFIYCDTDSLKYTGPCDFEKINAAYREDAEKHGGAATDPKGTRHYLGVYEDEGVYQDFLTWGAKKYIYRKDSQLNTVLGTGDTWKITIAGVGKKAGAVELEKRGGLQALTADESGRPLFTFRDAGGVEAIYNDHPEAAPIRHKGELLPVTRNLYLEQSEYTLGITDDFLRIINHPDLWRDLLDARAEV